MQEGMSMAAHSYMWHQMSGQLHTVVTLLLCVKSPSLHCIGDRVSLRAILGVMVKKNVPVNHCMD